MKHCTGILGKQCSCGLYHAVGGRLVDTEQHKAPPRFPFAPGSIDGPDGEDSLFYQEGATRSLLASPMFWIGGALAVALWTATVWWVTQ